MTAWSAVQYTGFEDERSRPAAELLARVPLDRPARVVDIGCGPGNSTELLVRRFPDAEATGLATSPDMLVAARQRLPATTFVDADIRAWTPPAPVDLFFANAVFQWVPGHGEVLTRLMETLSAAGVLAFQVPDNLGEPTHALMREVAFAGPWKAKFSAPIEREEVPAPAVYYDLLRPLSASVDIWSTTYNHVLENPAAILQWVLGTGLRPYLARLDETERAAYLADYESRLARAYPSLVDGKILLRFPRLFVVAVRGP